MVQIFKGGSQVWKHMLENRKDLEQHLWWEPRGGTSKIWYDNWINLGPLYLHQSNVHTCHPMRDVGEFLTEEGWDFDALLEFVMDHIKLNMFFVQPSDQGDKPWWTKSSTGHRELSLVLKVLESC